MCMSAKDLAEVITELEKGYDSALEINRKIENAPKGYAQHYFQPVDPVEYACWCAMEHFRRKEKKDAD